MHVYSFNNKPICMHVKYACAYVNTVHPLPSGEISWVTFIGMSWQTDAVTFRAWQDFEVQRDFEEIWYFCNARASGLGKKFV